MIDNMIESSPNLIPCIGNDCNYCISADETVLNTALNSLPAKDSICVCGVLLCMGCGSSGHEPLSCEAFEKWDSSVESMLDNLNLNWKKKNTKSCPKCKAPIEKNSGCMHMTCYKCHHNFCWLCLDDWTVRFLDLLLEAWIEHWRLLQM